MKPFRFTVFALILIMVSCQEKECFDSGNPDCSNYTPCENPDTLTADFLIQQQQGPAPYNNIFVADDSIFRGGHIRFQAWDENADHTWYFDGETIQSPSFVRLFNMGQEGNTLPGMTISLSHVVHRDSTFDCHAGPTLKDSIYKQIYFVESFNEFEVTGDFRIAFDTAPEDSFNIRIYFANDENTGHPEEYLYIENLFNREDLIKHETAYATNMRIQIDGTGVSTMRGSILVDKRKKIKALMEYNGERISLRGRKRQ